MIELETENIFEEFKFLHDLLKNKEVKIDDSIIKASFQLKEEKHGNTYIMRVSDFDFMMFSIEITNFDFYAFKETVKHPFMWDGIERERFEKNEFNNFLCEKNIYKPFQLKITSLGKDYYFNEMDDDDNDSKHIYKLLSSVDLDEIIYKLNTEQYSVIEKNSSNIKP